MPSAFVNNIHLHYAIKGNGAPLVLVHGSWGDLRDWNRVIDHLSGSYTVIAYDRRGHSRSERCPIQGSPIEDADDLAGLIAHLEFDSVMVAANSWGGIVALHCALGHPGLVRKLALHEPPLFDLLRGRADVKEVYESARADVVNAAQRLAEGKTEEGVRIFVETAVTGPGGWRSFPASAKKTFMENAHTFLDEMRDPHGLEFDIDALGQLTIPVLLTNGTKSPPIYAPIVETLARAIPGVERYTFSQSGHIPQISDPEEYVAVLARFLDANR